MAGWSPTGAYRLRSIGRRERVREEGEVVGAESRLGGQRIQRGLQPSAIRHDAVEEGIGEHRAGDGCALAHEADRPRPR